MYNLHIKTADNQWTTNNNKQLDRNLWTWGAGN